MINKYIVIIAAMTAFLLSMSGLFETSPYRYIWVPLVSGLVVLAAALAERAMSRRRSNRK